MYDDITSKPNFKNVADILDQKKKTQKKWNCETKAPVFGICARDTKYMMYMLFGIATKPRLCTHIVDRTKVK